MTQYGSETDKSQAAAFTFLLPQADEAAEALDAAAVEAALSLCEENGHALSGAWEPGPFQPHQPHPTVPAGIPQPSALHCGLEGKADALEVQGDCLAAFPIGLRSLPPTSSSSCSLKRVERRHAGGPPRPGAGREAGEVVHPKSQISLDVSIKCESEKWAQQRPVKSHTGMQTTCGDAGTHNMQFV